MAIIVSFCPQRIPMPVLYGVFLYMGASSLRGIQVLQLLNSVFYSDVCRSGLCYFSICYILLL